MEMACQGCSLSGRPCMHSPVIGPFDAGILIVGGFPKESECSVTGNRTLYSKEFTALKGMVENVLADKHLACSSAIEASYAYSIRCAPGFDENKRRFVYSVEDITKCSARVTGHIDRHKSIKAIVALGGDGLRTLGIRQSPKDVRGAVLQFRRADGESIPVVATFSFISVMKNPGLADTFIRDIRKAACEMLRGSARPDRTDICVYRSADDIVRALGEIRERAHARRKSKGKRLPIAFDTETTSLEPYDMSQRVISISVSCAPWTGIAYPFEHSACPFSTEDFARVKKATEDLLGDQDVALVEANGKFDTQWLKYHYGMSINELEWDVVLAEHELDEDKKGEYGLKAITKDRYPELGGYEEQLHKLLSDKQEELNEAHRSVYEAWKDSVAAAMLSWWVGLGYDERLSELARWASRGYISLEDTRVLAEVKQRRLHGELVIPKKYMAAVNRMLSGIPPTEAHGLVLPEKALGDKPRKVTFEDIDIDVLLKYGAIDAMTTLLVYFEQRDDFEKDRQLLLSAERASNIRVTDETPPCFAPYFNITIPLSHVISRMEYYGVRIDRDRCSRYMRDISDYMEECRDDIYRLAGSKFSLSSSSPELANFLFNELGYEVKRYTDSGMPATDAESIKQLSDEHPAAGFLTALLRYRKCDKILNTYLANWMRMTERDGRLHGNYNIIGTSTFRLSSSNPNMQNVPALLRGVGGKNINIKALFIPDSDEYDIYELDISNAEMRMLTAYSKDEALTSAFNLGKDLHCLTAAGVQDTYSYDDIKAHKDDKSTEQYRLRQLAKKINFGTIYCMGAKTLSEKLWSDLRIRETEEQCQEYLDKFFEAYPGVKTYIDKTQEFAAKFNFTYTYTGRRRRFAIGKYDWRLANRLARQAVNARIQTTSSDVVMTNLINVDRWLRDTGLGRVILTVHDSIVFQAKKGATGIYDALYRIITEDTKTRYPWIPVEWKFDVAMGPSYGEAHEDVH